MRVLHLLKSTKYSGAENVVLTIMSLFPEAEMIYASPDGPIRKVVEARGLKFYPLENTSVGAVRRAIRDLKPDLIHAHDFSMATCAAWAAGKTPVVAHFHNNPLWLKKVCPQSVALALSLPRIRNVISVSNSIEAEYIFRGLLKPKNTVVGNVVNCADVRQKAQETCNCAQVDLVFLGRMTDPKCPLLFCQIVQRLREKRPQITARMIGDGELMSQVKDYVRQNGLESNVELAGFQSNPYPYLNAGKVMVMPSAWEGFGLAAVEGMCLGKPVVCSGVGGLADIVDETCGAVCKTIDEYCSAILKLLQDENAYCRCSANAVGKSMQYTDMQRYTVAIKSIYESTLEGSRNA